MAKMLKKSDKITERLDNILSKFNIKTNKLKREEKAVLIKLLNRCNPILENKDKQWISKYTVDYRELWRFDLW